MFVVIDVSPRYSVTLSVFRYLIGQTFFIRYVREVYLLRSRCRIRHPATCPIDSHLHFVKCAVFSCSRSGHRTES